MWASSPEGAKVLRLQNTAGATTRTSLSGSTYTVEVGVKPHQSGAGSDLGAGMLICGFNPSTG